MMAATMPGVVAERSTAAGAGERSGGAEHAAGLPTTEGAFPKP